MKSSNILMMAMLMMIGVGNSVWASEQRANPISAFCQKVSKALQISNPKIDPYKGTLEQLQSICTQALALKNQGNHSMPDEIKIINDFIASINFALTQQQIDALAKITSQFSSMNQDQFNQSKFDIANIISICNNGLNFQHCQNCQGAMICVNSPMTICNKYNIQDVNSYSCEINLKAKVKTA